MSVGNVLVDAAGQPRLVELDGCAIGPREWDLALTALYYERFGWHTGEEYEAFCQSSRVVDVMLGMLVGGLLDEPAQALRLAHTPRLRSRSGRSARLITYRGTVRGTNCGRSGEPARLETLEL
jgi:hypothetical protein